MRLLLVILREPFFVEYFYGLNNVISVMPKLYSRKLLRCWSKKWQDTASAIKPVSHLATNGYLQYNIGTKKNPVGMTNILTPRIPQRDPVGVFRGLEKTKPCVRRAEDHHGPRLHRRASGKSKGQEGFKSNPSPVRKNYSDLIKPRLPKSLRNVQKRKT